MEFHHRDPEFTERNQGSFCLPLCLCVSVVNSSSIRVNSRPFVVEIFLLLL